MSERVVKSPAMDSGYEDKQSSNDESQSRTVITYRVYINRVPAEMCEEEVYEIILAMIDEKPTYFKMCWSNGSNRYRTSLDGIYEKYCIVEYAQESTGRALVEALHQKPPNHFSLNFRVHERTVYSDGRGYKTQQFYSSNQQQRGGHYRYVQNNASSGNYPHRYNNNGYHNKRGNYNNNPRMPLKSPLRGHNPSYFKRNDDFNGYAPLFSSPPNVNGVPVVPFPHEFPRQMAMQGPHPHLMLLGGVQLCYGCGAMTQSNCSTCFTPFCSGFCLSKPTNPSHPNECHTMFVNSPHQAVSNQPNFVWMQQQQQQMQQQQQFEDYAKPPPKNNGKRNKAKQQSAQQTGQGDRCDISAIEAGVKELTLADKPVAPAATMCNVPPPTVATPAPAPAYMPLTPSSTPPMAAQVETKQHKKVTTPPKVEINKTPDNNMMLKQNSTGNSPPTAEATPPAGQQLEPFVGTPQQLTSKMMVPPPGAMMMMHPPMPHGPPMMAGPGGHPQPVYVLLPNQQLMMAPFYGGGDFMQPPPANFGGEQPQFEFAPHCQQQPPVFEYAQNQPMAFNPLVPPAQGMQQMPQPYFYSNYQAY